MNPVLPSEWLTFGLALVLGLGVVLAWRAAASVSARLRPILVGLRLLGLLGLALIAFNPGRWRGADSAWIPEWAVLVDRSLSMATADVAGTRRWEAALAIAGSLARQATEGVQVRVVPFAGRLETPVQDLPGLRPDGETTDIVQATAAALDLSRAGNARLAGVLLLSDGRQVGTGSAGDLALRARALSVPIFPVVLGGTVPRRDVSVTPRRCQYVGFAGRPLRLAARVRVEGLGSVALPLTLVDAAGKTVAEERLEFAGDGEREVSFTVTPPAAGYAPYELRLPAWEGDGNPANNRAGLGLLALAEGLRVFVAEGVPSWDSKFLVQLLRDQPNLEVTAVYRLAAERFLRVAADPARAEEVDRAVFPDTAETLAAYDAVILCKGAEYFLTPARIALLRAFVRDHGGCLLCARGKPYSGEESELDSLLPGSWRAAPGRTVHFRPTDAGRDVGLFGERLAEPQHPSWARLPPLGQEYDLVDMRAFAQVLAEGVADPGQTGPGLPLLVSRRFGKGLTVVANADRFWQWDFFPNPKEGEDAYRELWSQLLLWALTYSEFVPGQPYAVSVSASHAFPETPVRIRVVRRDGNATAAAPTLAVWQDGAVVQRLFPAPLPEGGGRYQALCTLSQPGTYRFVVDGGALAATALSGALLVVEPRPGETAELSADPEFLRELAEGSGGRLIQAAEVSELVAGQARALPQEGVETRQWTPRWATAWGLCLLAGCFGLEWFLRRRHGLM